MIVSGNPSWMRELNCGGIKGASSPLIRAQLHESLPSSESSDREHTDCFAFNFNWSWLKLIPHMTQESFASDTA